MFSKKQTTQDHRQDESEEANDMPINDPSYFPPRVPNIGSSSKPSSAASNTSATTQANFNNMGQHSHSTGTGYPLPGGMGPGGMGHWPSYYPTTGGQYPAQPPQWTGAQPLQQTEPNPDLTKLIEVLTDISKSLKDVVIALEYAAAGITRPDEE